MKTEIKICLLRYKLVYSIFFIIILSLVRLINSTYEIGVAMETPVAFLTIVFCADTYLSERMNKRGDIFGLYSIKNRTRIIRKRILIQMIYLSVISASGYVLFWVKCMWTEEAMTESLLFVQFCAAITMTIIFWGMLSMTISNLTRNMWAGISIPVVLWLTLNSVAGSKLLGKWSVFSYTHRGEEHLYDWYWMYGKIVPILLVVIMFLVIPTILKKRG